MTLSMYQASAPVFLRNFNNLSAILDKAAAYVATGALTEADLLDTRLAPDMATLTRQVQIASDTAKGGIARLAGIEAPAMADDETSIEGLKTRIAKTVAFIGSVDAALVNGSEDRAITMKAGPREFHFTGQDYLLNFALPNFFFHVTTAYGLIRHRGVEIGKMDFLGGI